MDLNNGRNDASASPVSATAFEAFRARVHGLNDRVQALDGRLIALDERVSAVNEKVNTVIGAAATREQLDYAVSTVKIQLQSAHEENTLRLKAHDVKMDTVADLLQLKVSHISASVDAIKGSIVWGNRLVIGAVILAMLAMVLRTYQP